METLFAAVKDLALPAGNFAVFGSGPLIVRGIIPATNDLDIICRGAAWERVKTLGDIEYLPEYEVEVISLQGGRLSFGNRWAIGTFDVDQLIDSAEDINGLPFVRLEHVIKYKKERASRKDLLHIEALEKSAGTS